MLWVTAKESHYVHAARKMRLKHLLVEAKLLNAA